MALRQRQGRPEAEVQTAFTCLSLEVSYPLPGLGETELIINTPFPRVKLLPQTPPLAPQHSPGGIPSLFPGMYPERKEGSEGRADTRGRDTEGGRRRDRKGFRSFPASPSPEVT